MQRLTPKERGLIKGAIRRVFSRSDLRRKVIEASLLPKHTDDSRPRVKKWCECAICRTPTPKSYMEVDHIDPIIPVDLSLAEMSWDTLVNRIWCQENNLQAVCPTCHTVKTKAENKARRDFKKKGKK